MRTLPLVAVLVAALALVACGNSSFSRTPAQLRADATAAVLRAQADGLQQVQQADDIERQSHEATAQAANATATQRAANVTATWVAQPTATATRTPTPNATWTPLPTWTSTATGTPSATWTSAPTVERVVVQPATTVVVVAQQDGLDGGTLRILIVGAMILLALLGWAGYRWLSK